MGVTKEQLVSAVTKVKTYVDGQVAGVDTTPEVTYTDEEIDTAIDTVLGTTSGQA